MIQKIILLTIIALIAKINGIDAQISLSWAKGIGGVGDQQTWSKSMQTDQNGNVYTTGCFTGIIDMDPDVGLFNITSSGNYDIFISKLNNNGDFVWAKSIGGAVADYVYSLAIDDSCNIYLTGTLEGTLDVDPGIGLFNLTSNGSLDIFILKLDSAGNFVWAKKIGGALVDYCYSIATDNSGGVLLTGTFSDTVDFDPGLGTFNLNGYGTFILKLENDGNFDWAKRIGGSGYPTGLCVSSDKLGDVYIGGAFYGLVDFNPGIGVDTLSVGSSIYNSFILKLDIDGNYIWAKKIESISSSNLINSISIDKSGNVCSAGEFAGNTDFDPGGGTYILSTLSSDNGFISKLDNDGNFLWAKQIAESNAVSECQSISLDSMNSIYATGFFSSASDFDPGSDSYSISCNGIRDIFVLKIDSSGNFIWANSIGGPMDDRGSTIIIADSNKIYLSGYFNQTVDFNPEAGVFNLVSQGWNDVFIAKLIDNTYIGIEDYNSNYSISIFPNPTQGTVTIMSEPAQISIYNLTGEQVYITTSDQNVSHHNLSMLADGLYFVAFYNKNGSAATKLIIAK